MVDINTNLKINADASSAKKAGQEIKQAFSPQQLREFNRASKELGREFAGLVKHQVELNQQLRKTREGSRTYKDLAREIRDADRRAQGLSRTLQQLDRIQQQAAQRQQQGRMGRQGFVAGVASGAGLGTFIPQGPGMYPRMAGLALGGAIRRGAGAAAAPFAMPGIGGMSQALSGIPIIGGAMAGGLQMAAGAYQSAVGYDRQLLGMLSYAGTPATGDQRAAFERRNKAQAAAIRRQASRDAAGIQTQQQRTQADLERYAAAGRARGELVPTAVDAQGNDLPMIAGQRIAGTNLTAAAVDVGAEKQRQKIREAGEKRARALEKRRLPARGMPGLGEGVSYGMGPQQMMGLFGEMMQARGGTYDDVTRQGFRETMAAKTAFGIGGGQAGSFLRMGVAGGGGQNANLPQVLQAAMVQGLRGSQVPEYLSTLVSLGQQAERSGVKIDARGFTRMSAQLGGAGLQGLQAQRVAGGLNQAAMGLSQRGVQSGMDMIMLRAAGFDPAGGSESYAGAIQALEGGLNQDMLNNLLGSLTSGVSGSGMGPKMQGLMLRRAMGTIGVQIGGGQASRMLEAYKMGRPPSVESIVSASERPGAGGRMIRTAQGLVSREAGTTISAAGTEAGRIGIGRSATWVAQFEQNAQKTGAIMNNFGKNFNQLNKVVSQMLGSADKMTKGGLEGIFAKLRELLLGKGLDWL